MNRAVISVGSNIVPEKNIKAARDILAHEQVFIKESSFITTRPVAPAEGDDYLNGAFLIETALDMAALGRYLKKIEKRLGRVRGRDRFAPRTMDLDIIVYNGEIVDEDYFRYDFVKKAVDELMPSLKNKALKETP